MANRIQEDFTKIASSYEPLPDGDYEVTIEGIEETETQENKLPMYTFTLKVDDPRHPELEGYTLFDRAVTRTNKGQLNRAGLGRIKAYAEATLGEEAANSPEGIDPEEMINSKCVVVVKQRGWEKKDSNGNVIDSGMSNDIKKVLSVG